MVWVQHGRIVAQLQECFPEAARLLVEAAQTCWPSPASLKEYWRQIWSNNPQERLNREFRRRTDIVGIFPTGPPCCDWSAQFLAKQHDESPSPGAT